MPTYELDNEAIRRTELKHKTKLKGHDSQFPHCDARVLHAPGKCEFCDRHPEWQYVRLYWNINFTGEADPTKLKCPAEMYRDLHRIEQWGGNVSKKAPGQE